MTEEFFEILPVKKTFAGWHEILSDSICTAGQLNKFLPIDVKTVSRVAKQYPMRINPYYLSLIRKTMDPVWRQSVPDQMEIEDSLCAEDPLSEEVQSPVPNLIHRYPDRVLFMVSNQCAMYCRYCMRKRKIGRPFVVNDDTIKEGILYIGKEKAVRDVLISGGDPFLLEDEDLEKILKQLRDIPHIEIIRIHTRVPCTLPQRVTEKLAGILKKFHPIYINTHFNHPMEINSESAKACCILADSGIPLGCQTVLLKGVNDDLSIMKILMRKLLMIRVKPYYIHQADLVKGTGHFRTTIDQGIEIMKALRGYTSGIGVPYYMIDLPGGGGKVPVIPEYIKGENSGRLIVENYKGKIYSYPLADKSTDS
ncbi:MAG: lysine 2,3-aminomutase [Deltaproteobacteria bacterium]|nr:MAG: lysine 2,3-aminomutase [Deltaproteobacteria bacterium]